ncbi:MAG: arginine--tRNA ligase [bacterium]
MAEAVSMASIIDVLSQPILNLFSEHLTDRDDAFVGRVAPASHPKFGDYQFNGAMALAKRLGKTPRQVAEEVVRALSGVPWLEQAEIAGPGFVNLRLRKTWLGQQIRSVCSDERLGVERPGAGQRIVIDYSSPNVAKPMHIGHIRSTILGSALDRTCRFLGYEVVSDNHIGDWGTQFGILLEGYRDFAVPGSFEQSPIEELERVYIEYYKLAREDPERMDRARRELVKLQQGDPENRRLWERFVQASLQEFERLYSRLGVTFDVALGESFYNDRLAPLVKDLLARNLARVSDGAVVIPLEEEGLPPFLIQKSDGGFNYATTDIATLLYRIERWRPRRVLYVTDERQQLHFRQLFAVARRLGVDAGLEHVGFGIMRLPEGTFSTREGNVIRLERLLDEAERKAYEVVDQLNPALVEPEKREIARKVGLGAVKYADLSQNRQSTILFTWEKALSLEGNSAPYLQYTYARIRSVFRKYREESGGRDPGASEVVLEHDLESQIAKKILELPEHLQRSVAACRPNLFTDYLFDLASHYNRFYQNLPFLKAPDGVRESRLALCDLVGRIVRTGLGLLGIEAPERM